MRKTGRGGCMVNPCDLVFLVELFIYTQIITHDVHFRFESDW